MNISTEELQAERFRHVSVVYADVSARLHVKLAKGGSDVRGLVVYILVVDQELEKAGTTGRKNSTFKGRMTSTFNALRQVIIGGPPYLGDPFKQHAPATILANQEIELWAQGWPRNRCYWFGPRTRVRFSFRRKTTTVHTERSLMRG
jgi:hypothetical protein